jgi:hypothetical protein
MLSSDVVNDWLTGWLLDRASVCRMGQGVAAPLGGAVALCRRRGPLCGQDAALAVLALLMRARPSAPVAAPVDGLAGWLTALAQRAEVAQDVWLRHRGAVLFALECVAWTAAPWVLPEGEAARAALTDLLVREAGLRVGDRNGVSFRVFERTMEALALALAGAEADGQRRLLRETAERVAGFRPGDWPALRAWAGSLRRCGLYWPGQQAPPDADHVALQEGVPFGCLRPGPWPAALAALRDRFARDAGNDLRLYDEAPVSVAVAALLRDELAAAGGAGEFDRLLPALVDAGWALLLPGAMLAALAVRNPGCDVQRAVALARSRAAEGLDSVLLELTGLLLNRVARRGDGC